MAKAPATPGSDGGAHPKEGEAAFGLACPNCQGRLQIPEGVRIIRCPYCDQRSFVQGERGGLRYQVPRRLDRQAALATATGFLRGLDRAPGLSRQADFTDLFVVYLPFWSEWAEVAAWFFGKKRVGSGKNRRLVPKEVRLMGTRTWNQAACDVQEFGVSDISLAGQSLQAFDAESLHDDGMGFEPGSAAGAAWAGAGGRRAGPWPRNVSSGGDAGGRWSPSPCGWRATPSATVPIRSSSTEPAAKCSTAKRRGTFGSAPRPWSAASPWGRCFWSTGRRWPAGSS